MQPDVPIAEPIVGPEIVVGLIGPIGVELELLTSELEAAFSSVNYSTRQLHLIKGVWQYSSWNEPKSSVYHENYHKRMDAGNEFRDRLQRRDALACLAIAAVQNEREKLNTATHRTPASPIARCAYLLRSLKTPEEVELLREVYGSSFVAVAAYAPRALRLQALMRRIAQSIGDPETRRYEWEAAKLLRRDEFEQEEFGQNMRDTYPLADVFIDVSSKCTAAKDALRFVELLFGHPEHTPRRAEVAMFHAYGAKLRSASAGRQVGASIVNLAGDILAVGTNEVAKAHGGQYWSDEADKYDQRDYRRPGDSAATMLSALLHDLILRLLRQGWLADDKKTIPIDDLYLLSKEELLKNIPKSKRQPNDPDTLGDKALVEKVIEYMRSVHGEMAALLSCARRGVAVKGCDMYVTTFPCHECARLIVAAGIEHVYFIEPYPKSRVAEMYDDSITVDAIGDDNHVVFSAFVGVAPRCFVELFDCPEPSGRHRYAEVARRNSDGSWVRWENIKDRRWPRRYDAPMAILVRENNTLEAFTQQSIKVGIKQPTSEAV